MTYEEWQEVKAYFQKNHRRYTKVVAHADRSTGYVYIRMYLGINADIPTRAMKTAQYFKADFVKLWLGSRPLLSIRWAMSGPEWNSERSLP